MTSLITYLEDGFMNGTDRWFRNRPQPLPTLAKLEHCKLLSHRGERDDVSVYENTLASFEPLVKNNIWGTELDVRWSKDNVPMVFHDSNFQRLFGSEQQLAQLTFDEIRRQFPPVASLKEVVQQFGKKLHLVMELKEDRLLHSTEAANNFQQALAPLEAVTDFHMIAFDLKLLDSIPFWPKQTFLPIAYYRTKYLQAEIKNKGFGGITGHFAILSQRDIDYYHQHNLLVGTGQAASENCLRREINRGIDWIFSDHVLEMQHYYLAMIEQQQNTRTND